MDDSKIVDLYWARSDSAIAETAKKVRRVLPHHRL